MDGIVTMATDPVYGTAAEREKAVRAERSGEAFFFCSRSCREEFLGNLDPPPMKVGSASVPVTNQEENRMSHVPTQVVDPVCGMTIDRNRAVVVTYEGVPYSFCDAACAQIFRDEPERWVDEAPVAHDH